LTALRTLGIEIASGREGRAGTRIIRMSWIPRGGQHRQSLHFHQRFRGCIFANGNPQTMLTVRPAARRAAMRRCRAAASGQTAAAS